MFWPFTVWTNCSSDIKNFANFRPSASNFKSFALEHFLTVGQNNFGNKISLWAFIINENMSRENQGVCLDVRRHLQKVYPIFESTYLSVKPMPTAVVAQITINRRPIMMLSRLLGTLLLMSDRKFWALSSSWQKPKKKTIRYF